MTSLLLELDVARVSTLAKKWGNIPRTLLAYIYDEDFRIEARYRLGANTAIENCTSILTGGVELDLALPSPFYFVRPATDEGSIDRTLPDISLPTPTLCSFLAEALKRQQDITKL